MAIVSDQQVINATLDEIINSTSESDMLIYSLTPEIRGLDAFSNFYDYLARWIEKHPLGELEISDHEGFDHEGVIRTLVNYNDGRIYLKPLVLGYEWEYTELDKLANVLSKCKIVEYKILSLVVDKIRDIYDCDSKNVRLSTIECDLPDLSLDLIYIIKGLGFITNLIVKELPGVNIEEDRLRNMLTSILDMGIKVNIVPLVDVLSRIIKHPNLTGSLDHRSISHIPLSKKASRKLFQGC